MIRRVSQSVSASPVSLRDHVFGLACNTPKKESLQRAAWRILVTNLDAVDLDAKAVSELNALRWSIEIKFGPSDSPANCHGLKHRSGYHHIVAMVLAAML